MRNTVIAFLFMLATLPSISIAQQKSNLNKLKIALIRHGEKPLKGDNLTCKGLNRALLLPAVIKAKFGVPDFVYVPAMTLSTATLHSRMFQHVCFKL